MISTELYRKYRANLQGGIQYEAEKIYVIRVSVSSGIDISCLW